MIIHKNCYGTILLVMGICLPIVFLILWLIPWTFVSYPLATIPVFFIGFVLFFFRVPSRQRVGDDNVVTSVADGQVVVIDKAFEPEFLKKECLQVSVYMDFFNVHVNFWPADGEVTYFKYHPGKYLLAYLPKASELNEHASTSMTTPYGDIFFKQIAGTFARRIVSYAKPGLRTVKAEQCGIIKFGSRVDMFLPLDAEIKVKVGDYVKACDSIIAELKK
ncbi:MAG: phosphatidylserine decarboxylase family protein [Bacteroidales bacterium]|nr:phosphatidylserine decarboxylase family protein [Bacteroidales bacterium]